MSGPKAPDPVKTAAAQTQSNIDTATKQAELNRVNQYNPYGSSEYSITGTNPDGTPIYSQTTKLSEPQQQIFDAQQKQDLGLTNTANTMLGQVQNAYSSPMDTSSAGSVNFGLSGDQMSQYQDALNKGFTPEQMQQFTGSLNTTAGDAATAGYGKIQDSLKVTGDQLSDDLNKTRDAYYNQQKAYLDPQWQQQQTDLDTKLVNQGLVQGSDAYNKAMAQIDRDWETTEG